MYRKNSVINSVYHELLKIKPGSSRLISISDFKGDPVDVKTIRMAVSKISSDNNMAFVTRVDDSGLMIWRLE